jgi:ABC-type uncharacterized transport system substrate-binding protein
LLLLAIVANCSTPLRRFGLTQTLSEGRNLIYFSAAAEGDLSRLPQLAKPLVEARVDVIIAVGTIAARAALTASTGTSLHVAAPRAAL